MIIPTFPERRRWLLAAAALCAVTLAVYANSFGCGFVLDNSFLLTEARIQAATAANLRLIWNHTYWWPAGESGLYRPFTALTFLFNYAILGNRDSPEGYHWINIVIHLCNVLLVFALARRMVREFRPAVAIAGLWAVHPVLTEGVTNIVGRAELLAAMSVLSGLLLYLKSTEAAGWRKGALLAALMCVTAVGVFSKESAVTIVGVIAVFEFAWWRERKQARGFLLGMAALAPPVAFMLYQRGAVLKASQPALFPFVDNPLGGTDFWIARLTAVKILGRYLGLIVWPATLSCDYSYPQIPLATGSFSDWAGWTAVAVACTAALLAYRWNRAAFFFASFAFVTLLPGSNLIITIGTVMAERLLYLPSFGLVACLVLALDWLLRRLRLSPAAPLVFCLIAAAFGARTWARNVDWRDEITLAEAAQRASPRSFKVYGFLADALHHADPTDANIDQTIAVSDRGVALLDSLPDRFNTWRSYSQSAGYYQKKGDLLNQKRWDGTKAPDEESREAWRHAVKLLKRAIAIIQAERKPVAPKGVFVTASTLSEHYRAISVAYSRLGEVDNAYRTALEARDADPMSPTVYRRISVVLRAMGRNREAAVTLMEGCALTGDATLDEGLPEIYQGAKELDPKGCAVVKGINVVSQDTSCDAVRTLRCGAMDLAAWRALSMGRKVRARRIAEAAAALKCHPG